MNRLSLGVQSFDDARLAAIGRVHGADEARRALDAALAIFPTVNVDLMYALPGPGARGARSPTCARRSRFGAPHVSAYHLTLEPDTHFHRFPPELPADDVAADMQEGDRGAARRARATSTTRPRAFARPGHRARHNLNYWTFGDYLGIGAGAHGKISFRDRIVREVRERKPQALHARGARRATRSGSRATSPTRELPFEFMLNALRLIEGFPGGALRASAPGCRSPWSSRSSPRPKRAGLIERDHARIAPTPKGRRFLNDLLEGFLGPAPARAAASA